MTRASLLHILDHVSVISDAEIRELEQLAAAFPYCQTAHILLAKTAHDRGSMLASQRLRRAATYAANRDLLRQLLEQPSPTLVAATTGTGLEFSSTALLAEKAVQPEAEYPQLVAEVEEILEQEATGSFSSQPTEAAESAQERAPSSSIATSDAALEVETKVSEAEATPSTQDAEPIAPIVPLENVSDVEVSSATYSALQHDLETALEVDAAPSEKLTFSESGGEATTDEAFSEPTKETQQEEALEVVTAPATLIPAASAAPETQESAFHSGQEQTEAGTADHTGLEPEPQEVAQIPTPQEPVRSIEKGINDLLPATAPPIRPPVEAGISRFEFELVEPTLPEPSGYLLPDLEEEVAEEPILSEILQRTAPAFHADEDLGYALSAGSRLGYDLQQHDGFTLDLPLDAFFEPDALLLAHIAAHRPKPSTSSLDLINRFLKTKPRIKTAAVDAKPVEEQADLSVRSIQAAPALASESLAKIMVKQGKIDKAIEIYERLMTRQPEKKAYFADQIQQLKQPSA